VAARLARAAFKALERAGAVRDADLAIRELAHAMDPRLDVTVTSRTDRATCNAPNCAGHRTRA
jgi:hypothetical protein